MGHADGLSPHEMRDRLADIAAEHKRHRDPVQRQHDLADAWDRHIDWRVSQDRDAGGV